MPLSSMPLDPEPILRIIQAATAPVVLISGVGLLLLTLTARLGRIVDRTRLLAAERLTVKVEDRAALETQLAVLRRRARLIRLAVALSATCVATVGLLITVLFVGLLENWNVGHACILLFIIALMSLVVAMLVFVRELFDSLTALDMSVENPTRR